MNTKGNGKTISDTGMGDKQYSQREKTKQKRRIIRTKVFLPFKKLNKQKKSPKTYKPKINKLFR